MHNIIYSQMLYIILISYIMVVRMMIYLTEDTYIG